MTRFLDGVDPAHFTPESRGHRQATDVARQSNADGDYALRAGTAFDALKQALSLMAGVLLLDVVGAERTVIDRPLGEKARDVLAEARAAMAGLRPGSLPLQHHAHHLQRALALATEAADWGSRQATLIGRDHTQDYTDAIRAAWAELSHMDQLLQGFSMIDLSQSCCSFHADLAAQSDHDGLQGASMKGQQ